MILIYPLALLWAVQIDRNAKLLLTLQSNKKPPKIGPWWLCFSLTEYLYQQEAVFRLASGDIYEV